MVFGVVNKGREVLVRCLCFVGLLSAFPVLADGGALHLTDGSGVVFLGEYLGYKRLSEVKAAEVTISDVAREVHDASRQGSFVYSKRASHTFGHTDDIYWFHGVIKNASSMTDFMIEQSSSWIDRMDVYYVRIGFDPAAGSCAEFLPDAVGYTSDTPSHAAERIHALLLSQGCVHMRLGDHRPFSDRIVDHHNFLIPLKLFPGQAIDFYLRVNSKTSLAIPLTVRPASEIEKHHRNQNLFYGVFVGVMLASLFYSSYHAITLKSRTHLYYVFFIVSTVNLVFHIEGFAFEFIWREVPEVLATSTAVSLTAMPLFAAMLVRSFFHEKIQGTLSSKLLIGLQLTYTFLIVLILLGVWPVTLQRIALSVAPLYGPVLIVIGARMWVQGTREARFLTVGWTASVFGTVITWLTVHGHIEYSAVRYFAMPAGFLVDVTLLSFAISEKVKALADEVQNTRQEIINRLGMAAENKDPETGDHIVRMSVCSRQLGLLCGLKKAEADLLAQASPMHDVGKIGIPDHILNKPGKLTEDEFRVMKTHTEIGARILDGHDSSIMVAAKEIAWCHHENWDGTGYPRGLAGEDIPLFGRICAIADVFDALTSERPYKKAWSVDDAVAEIKRLRGKKFDPRLVDIFIDNVDLLISKQHASMV